jgi:hypothetical protein
MADASRLQKVEAAGVEFEKPHKTSGFMTARARMEPRESTQVRDTW